MTPLAWLTMSVVCGIVWGGFVVLLIRALRFEGAKARERR